MSLILTNNTCALIPYYTSTAKILYQDVTIDAYPLSPTFGYYISFYYDHLFFQNSDYGVWDPCSATFHSKIGSLYQIELIYPCFSVGAAGYDYRITTFITVDGNIYDKKVFDIIDTSFPVRLSLGYQLDVAAGSFIGFGIYAYNLTLGTYIIPNISTCYSPTNFPTIEIIPV